MLYCKKEKLPKFMLDGSLLFTTSSLTSDGSVLVPSAKDEQTKKDVRISIKLATDYLYVQFFNIVLRAAICSWSSLIATTSTPRPPCPSLSTSLSCGLAT